MWSLPVSCWVGGASSRAPPGCCCCCCAMDKSLRALCFCIKKFWGTDGSRDGGYNRSILGL